MPVFPFLSFYDKKRENIVSMFTDNIFSRVNMHIPPKENIVPTGANIIPVYVSRNNIKRNFLMIKLLRGQSLKKICIASVHNVKS